MISIEAVAPDPNTTPAEGSLKEAVNVSVSSLMPLSTMETGIGSKVFSVVPASINITAKVEM